MLPSCGHFKNILCPFYKLALCVRPHCPYKHQTADNGHPRQVLPSLVDETESLFDSKINVNAAQKRTYDQTVTVKQENVTYIPTPVESNSKPTSILKSSSNFEKPSSSYVPEYKPTPISKLKECTPINVKPNKSKYSPEYPTTLRRKKNVEEYDPTEVKCIPKKSVTFVDCPSSGDSDVPVVLISSDDELDSESAPKFSDDDFEDESPSISNSKIQETNKTADEADETIQEEEDEIEVIEIDEFSIVDKILVDSKNNEMLLKAKHNSKLHLKTNDSASKGSVTQKLDKNRTVVSEKTELKNKKTDNNLVIKIEKPSSNITVTKSDIGNSKTELKVKKESSSEIKEKKKSDSKELNKSDKEKNKSQKSKDKTQKHHSHSTHKETHKKDSKESSDKSKHSKKVSSETKKAHPNNIENSTINSQMVTKHSSDKTTSKKKANEEQKVKQSNSNNGPSVKKSKYFDDSRSQPSSESSKLKDKTSSKHSSGKRKSDSDSEHHNSKHKSLPPDKKKANPDNGLPHSKKHKSVDLSSDSKSEAQESSDSDDDMSINLNDFSSYSDSDPDEECRRIFNESYPEHTKEDKKEKSPEKKEKAKDLVILRKKRYAHPAAIDLKKPASSQKKMDVKKILHPSQVMLNRFAQSQAKFSSQNEIKDDSSARSLDKKRLNFHPNRSLLAAVKSRVNETNPALGNFSPLPSTVTKTLKVTQRVAHIPEAALKPRPIIPTDFGSKVPANIRQKFLDGFINECLKFSSTEDEAYDLALEEEKTAFGRSSSKALYMNVAANTLKRLRNQAKAGPKVNDGASPKKVSSKAQKRTVSHETVLNGPLAQRRSFSIERIKRQTFDIKDLGGTALYEHLSSYILTPEQLKENGFPLPHPLEKDRAVIEGVYANRAVYCNDAFKRTCCRCQKIYYVNVDSDYVRDEECDFHWGRLWKKRIAGSLESRYSCCQGDSESDGCCVSAGHVFEGSEAHALKGFVKTLPKTPPQDNFYGIYSLDCEMCYTAAGMELTRVTVIDADLKTVYESFVKPHHQVLDYNTRFSGITEDDLKNVKTSILDVQAVLLLIFNSKTILIGHSLESDFKALKIFHTTVIDTSVVFPHKNGLPSKRALRTLMAEKLNKIIQNDVGGHDSHEDAAACMELMLWKIKEDMKGNR